MAIPSTTPAPGAMTVPLLFGWEVILVVLVVLVVLAVGVVALATRAGRGDRSEWEAWLDTRSAGQRRPIGENEPSVRSGTG